MSDQLRMQILYKRAKRAEAAIERVRTLAKGMIAKAELVLHKEPVENGICAGEIYEAELDQAVAEKVLAALDPPAKEGKEDPSSLVLLGETVLGVANDTMLILPWLLLFAGLAGKYARIALRKPQPDPDPLGGYLLRVGERPEARHG